MKQRIKFCFKDEDGNVLKDNFGIELEYGDKWSDIEAKLSNMLYHMLTNTRSYCDTSARIHCGEWMMHGKFPDGTHYFIADDNEFGFTSGYLYRVYED